MIPGQAQQFFEAAAAQASGGYEIERSLRFNSGDSAYLNRTPSDPGNRRTFTLSFWIKRAALTSNTGHAIFYAGTAGSTQNRTGFLIGNASFSGSGNSLVFGQDTSGSWTTYRETSAIFRDHSAWAHIVLAVDSTQATASNRIKIYVNGVLQTSFAVSNDPAQDLQFFINKNDAHYIARDVGNFVGYLDAYLGEVHFIDGSQLAASDFGEDDDNNVWQPKEYSGSYGPTPVSYSDNGQTDLPDGNVYLNTQPVGNIFDGDESTYARINRGTNSQTVATFRWQPTNGFANVTKIEIKTDYTTGYSINGGSFQNYTQTGFTTIYNGSSFTLTQLDIRRTNASGSDYGIFVYGIKINDVLITNVGNNGFHLNFSDNSTDAALGTDSSGNNNDWTVNNISGPGSDVDYTTMMTQQSNGGYHSGAGPEKAFDGLLTTAPRTSASNNNGNITFTPSPSISHTTLVRAYWQHGNVSATYSYNGGSATAITASGWITLASGSGTFTSLNTDRDGDGNYFSAIEIDGTILLTSTGADNDSLIDTPTNYTAGSGNNGGNYCTLNPLDKASTQTVSDGNLQLNINQSLPTFAATKTTFGISSGKFYWEFVKEASSSFGTAISGIWPTDETSPTLTTDLPANIGSYTDLLGFGVTGANVQFRMMPSGNVQSGSYTEGQVFGIAFDADAGKFYAFINGSEISGQNISAGTSVFDTVTVGKTYVPFGYNGNGGSGTENVEMTFNFGQRAYAFPPGGTGGPPSDYKSVCTTNFTNITIAEGATVMDTNTYQGNNTFPRSITGLNFSPDFVWTKVRSQAYRHMLFDTVRGTGKNLTSNNDLAETTDDAYGYISAFNNDGWTIAQGSTNGENFNANGDDYVAWTWDAGTSNTTISAGSLNSSAYNTSDRWRDDVAGQTYGSQPKTRLFDGNIAQNLIAESGYSLTFSPSGFSSITSLRVYGSSYTGNANGIVINGTDYTSLFPSGSTTPGWATIPETSLTSIVWNTASNGLENGSLNAIEVDGKILIDDDATPPNVPLIASTVRANTSAGFSIVSYTGNGTSPSTIGHGLNAVPGLIIVKNRSSTQNWAVYHTGLIDGSTVRYLRLNTADGQVTGSGHWQNTVPTSSIFTVGNDGQVNANGDDLIAYCFAPVEGYSAFGVYIGNGSADGPYVYTGFRPAFVLLKLITGGSARWFIFDATRDPINSATKSLYPDRADQEGSSHPIDFLSNGFKLREADASGYTNLNGSKYIYAAFAEHPFKTSRAR